MESLVQRSFPLGYGLLLKLMTVSPVWHLHFRNPSYGCCFVQGTIQSSTMIAMYSNPPIFVVSFLGCCNPPEVYNFIRSLGLFTGLASYLGYGQEFIQNIQAASMNSRKNQWVLFLHEWQMPDCGTECTRRILDEMASCGNLQHQPIEGMYLVNLYM